MTNAELVAILLARPKDAPVYVWDGDDARFTPVDGVSDPAAKWIDAELQRATTLPLGAIFIWGM